MAGKHKREASVSEEGGDEDRFTCTLVNQLISTLDSGCRVLCITVNGYEAMYI